MSVRCRRRVGPLGPEPRRRVPFEFPEGFQPVLCNELPLDRLGRVQAHDHDREIVSHIYSCVIGAECERTEHGEAVT
jgi:hypothetical protein